MIHHSPKKCCTSTEPLRQHAICSGYWEVRISCCTKAKPCHQSKLQRLLGQGLVQEHANSLQGTLVIQATKKSIGRSHEPASHGSFSSQAFCLRYAATGQKGHLGIKYVLDVVLSMQAACMNHDPTITAAPRPNHCSKTQFAMAIERCVYLVAPRQSHDSKASCNDYWDGYWCKSMNESLQRTLLNDRKNIPLPSGLI